MTTAREQAREVGRIAYGYIDPNHLLTKTPVDPVIDAVSDMWEPKVDELKQLLRSVLASPTNHTGVRSDEHSAWRYEAKRLDVELLAKVREALGEGPT